MMGVVLEAEIYSRISSKDDGGVVCENLCENGVRREMSSLDTAAAMVLWLEVIHWSEAVYRGISREKNKVGKGPAQE